MAQKKAGDVEKWLSRPDPATRLVLIYGPDRGLVSERARRFAVSSGLDLDDPFAVIRLDAGEVESDIGRLHDEVRMVPLFGGKRLIWLRNAGSHKALAGAVKALLADPPDDATILIEAGDLKKGTGLRGAVENAPAGMALPCYADDARSLEQLMESTFAEAGLNVSSDARLLLKSLLGGDRLAIRGELEKLVLYCRSQSRVEAEDVAACCGDIASASADTIVDAALIGNIDRMDAQIGRFTSSGAAPFLILSSAMRQFQTLSGMRHAVEAERRSVATVIASARPPIFFARRPVMERALQGWTSAAIASALDRLQAAVLLTRKRPDLTLETVRQTMIALAVIANRQASPRRA
ncbi:DNA polymerase III subunit delta [Mesorhizobium xinjiangense]|uniref:DNA polymerase III subunit delta n=1 Tax=Mesorhizobium xinjiangense TaxID=2678685 RepID=UPI0012ED4DFD|nr:DNA polymerase III subunit delta [Mesorhizobium xinjiangense]